MAGLGENQGPGCAWEGEGKLRLGEWGEPRSYQGGCAALSAGSSIWPEGR